MNWYKLAKKETQDERNNRLDMEIIKELDTPKWILVDSDWISAISYSDFAKKLEVKIKSNNEEEPQIFSFNNVPKKVFKAFLSAPSKGGFFNKIIRPEYGAN